MTSHAANCRNWEAYHDHMPPGPFVLRVTGQCDVPHGKTVKLKRHASHDPKEMKVLLDIVVNGPEVPEGTARVAQDVRYEEETEIEYEAVTIRLTVPVHDVF